MHETGSAEVFSRPVSTKDAAPGRPSFVEGIGERLSIRHQETEAHAHLANALVMVFSFHRGETLDQLLLLSQTCMQSATSLALVSFG